MNPTVICNNARRTSVSIPASPKVGGGDTTPKWAVRLWHWLLEKAYPSTLKPTHTVSMSQPHSAIWHQFSFKSAFPDPARASVPHVFTCEEVPLPTLNNPLPFSSDSLSQASGCDFYSPVSHLLFDSFLFQIHAVSLRLNTVRRSLQFSFAVTQPSGFPPLEQTEMSSAI